MDKDHANNARPEDLGKIFYVALREHGLSAKEILNVTINMIGYVTDSLRTECNKEQKTLPSL